MSDLENDPKERDPKYRAIIAAAEKDAEKIGADMEISRMGTCYAIWDEQKKMTPVCYRNHLLVVYR